MCRGLTWSLQYSPFLTFWILVLLLEVLLLYNCPPQYCHFFCCSQTQKGLVTNLMRNRYMLDELTSDVSYSAIGLVWIFKKSVNNNYFIHKTRNTLCCSVDITVTCVNLVFPLGAVIHWSTVQINFILCNCHENQNWKPTVIVTWEAESKQPLGLKNWNQPMQHRIQERQIDRKIWLCGLCVSICIKVLWSCLTLGTGGKSPS